MTTATANRLSYLGIFTSRGAGEHYSRGKDNFSQVDR